MVQKSLEWHRANHWKEELATEIRGRSEVWECDLQRQGAKMKEKSSQITPYLRQPRGYVKEDAHATLSRGPNAVTAGCKSVHTPSPGVTNVAATLGMGRVAGSVATNNLYHQRTTERYPRQHQRPPSFRVPLSSTVPAERLHSLSGARMTADRKRVDSTRGAWTIRLLEG